MTNIMQLPDGIAEVIVYTNALSSNQMAAVQGYLAKKYRLEHEISPWMIIAIVVGILIVVCAINMLYYQRKYYKRVDERLEEYRKLVKSCPKEQVAIVFQEITEYMEMTAMNRRHVLAAHCLLAYLHGRCDEGKPAGQQIVLI